MYPSHALPIRRTTTIIGLFLALAWTSPAFSAPNQRANADTEALTHSLVGLNTAYQKSAPNSKSQALQRLIDATIERQALLAELIESDPGAVLRTAMPARIRNQMPAEVREFIEQRLELEGELEVMYEDYKDGSYRLRHTLKADGELIALHFKSPPNGLLSGTPAKVSGVLVSETTMALESGEKIQVMACCNGSGEVSTANSTPELPNTFGEQRTLVLLVNFQDYPANTPWTIDEVHTLIFGPVADFYFETSYQQTWLTGDTEGWFTLPMNSVCDRDLIAAEADAAVAATGIDPLAHDRIVYVFPEIACGGAGGYGTLGGNPSRAWINGALYLKLVAHEMGHNFGLDHSRGMNCQGGVITADCELLEYGDGLDAMGSRPAHFNAYQKERLGWLGHGTSLGITAVDSSGTFIIEPYESVSQGVKALKILQGVEPVTGQKTWYYLDYRQPVGFDGQADDYYLDGDNVFNGVLFRKVTENDFFGSWLLDMTPDSYLSLWRDLDDPALVTGASYTDSAAGLTVTTGWTDVTGATVNVSYGDVTCVRATPQLAISPSEGDWVPPGTAVNYSITITNNDSTACNASAFAMGAAIPFGWSAAFTQSALTVDPGASTSTTLEVVSAQSEEDGFYTIDVSASNTNDGTYSTTGSVTYVVSAPTEPPINSSPVAINDNVTLMSKSAINIAVLANDSDPDGDELTISNFSNGAKGTVSKNPDDTLTYTPGKRFKSSDSFSYTVSDGKSAASATVSISLQVLGDGGGGRGGKGKPKK